MDGWILPHLVLSSYCPQLLKSHSATNAPDNSMLGPYFQDGQRRIDYILTYHVDKLQHTHHHSSSTFKNLKDSLSCVGRCKRADSTHHDLESASNAHIHREEFEHKLLDMGLQLEKEEDVSIHVIFCSRYFPPVPHDIYGRKYSLFNIVPQVSQHCWMLDSDWPEGVD